MASYIITKEIARQAAGMITRKMYEEKDNTLEGNEKKLGDFIAKKYFPKEVLEAVEKYGDYLGHCNYIFVFSHYKGEKQKHLCLGTTVKIPCGRSGAEIDYDDYKLVVRILGAKEAHRKDKEGTRQTLREQIMKLRTYSRVEKEAPELLPYIPAPAEPKKLPAPQWDDLRKLLQEINTNFKTK